MDYIVIPPNDPNYSKIITFLNKAQTIDNLLTQLD